VVKPVPVKNDSSLPPLYTSYCDRSCLFVGLFVNIRALARSNPSSSSRRALEHCALVRHAQVALYELFVCSYPAPDTSGHRVLFSLDFFVYFFVSLSARLRANGWTDLHEIFREGVE